MTEKTQKLKPCPFCGGKDIDTYSHSAGSFYISTCLGCYAEGPEENTRELAIAAWNRRAPQCEKE